MTAATGAAAATPEEEFQTGEDAFRYQNYEQAVRALEAVLYPQVRLGDPQRVLRAREMLGASYWWLDRKDSAKDEFIALLTKAPDYELDAFYHPPPLIRFFEDVRDQLERSNVIGDGGGEQTAPQPSLLRTKTVTVEHHPFVLNLVPFGVGQFENGDTTAGVLFLVGETLALAGTVASYFLILDVRQDDPERAREFRTAFWASQGAFWGLVAGGILHASLRWEPVTITETEVETPLPPPEPVTGAPQFRPGLAVTPDAGIFLGFGGTF
jgi:hypothetical protein